MVERIRVFLQSPDEILDAVKQVDLPEGNYDRLLKHAKQRSSDWNRRSQPERVDLIRAMLHRVIAHEGSIELQLDLEATIQVVLGKTTRDKSKK